jgi:hypothetical protein
MFLVFTINYEKVAVFGSGSVFIRLHNTIRYPIPPAGRPFLCSIADADGY